MAVPNARRQDLNEAKKNRRQWQHAGHFNVNREQTEIKCAFPVPVTAIVWIVEFSGFYHAPGQVEKVERRLRMRSRADVRAVPGCRR